MKKLSLIFVVIFITSSAYAQWIQQVSGTTDLLYSIQFADNNNGWVVNLNGTKLFHTSNGGEDWFIQKDFIASTIWNFTFINDSIGYIYSHGAPAHLFKTFDGGTTWQTIYTFSSSTDDLKFYDENTGWCVSNELSGSLSKTTNGGLNWQGINYFNSFSGILGKIGIIDENSIIVTGDDPIGGAYIFKTTDGGATWIEITNTYGLLGGRIQFINNNIGWIGSPFSGLYKTKDGGFNWELQVPYLYDFFFINENEGWYVANNQIKRTADGGLNWVSQNSGTNNTLYTMYFLDNNNGWVCGDSGVILRTMNGGIPVELTSFTSSVNDNSVTLIWQTATETNNQGFDIERNTPLNPLLREPVPIYREAAEGRGVWKSIGFVNGKGTTTEPQSYSFVDENLPSGKYQYRLKQTDFDGTFEYSNTIEIEINQPTKFSLDQNYPNPFNPSTNIQYAISSRQFVTLKVYDVLGKEVATLVNGEKPAGSYDADFNASHLASGIYYYELRAGDFVETKKMILMK